MQGEERMIDQQVNCRITDEERKKGILCRSMFCEKCKAYRTNISYLPTFPRAMLHDMTTTQLYGLDGECTKLQEKIKAELILRGDY